MDRYKVAGSKVKAFVAVSLLLPALAFAETTPLGTAVAAAATDFKSQITENVPAIMGVVALVAAVVFFMKIFKRH